LFYSCQDERDSTTNKSSKSGDDIRGICEIEESEGDSITTRFYDIAVSAKDAAGNVGIKKCSVIVIPQQKIAKGSKGSRGGDVGIANQPGVVRRLASKGGLPSNELDPDVFRLQLALSTQRYVISQRSLEWDPSLDITLTVPELPEPESQTNPTKGKGSKRGRRTCAVACEEEVVGSKGTKGSAQLEFDEISNDASQEIMRTDPPTSTATDEPKNDETKEVPLPDGSMDDVPDEPMDDLPDDLVIDVMPEEVVEPNKGTKGSLRVDESQDPFEVKNAKDAADKDVKSSKGPQ
jgi:hypothetical protein